MKKKLLKLLCFTGTGFLMFMAPSTLAAEEKVIQQENLSFDRCLKVILTSQEKLSISPEIINISDQKQSAVFTLIDGTLTITCDGVKGNVTVITNTN